MARIATDRGDVKGVELALSLVLEGYDQCLLDLASAYCAIGKFDLAEPALRDAIDLDYRESFEMLLFVLLETDRFDQAQGELDLLVQTYEPEEYSRLQQMIDDAIRGAEPGGEQA